jgi:hypothetical protein
MPAALALPAAAAGGSLADEQPLACTRSGQVPPLEFIADYLTADDPADWTAASDLVSGERLDALFDMPRRQWNAPAPAAAVLAWKTYTYRLAQPLATAWTLAREIPLLSEDNVLVKILTEAPYVTLGLRRSTSAVLPTSCTTRSHDAIVIPDEPGLLTFLRDTLIDQHLSPLLERTMLVRRVGARILWGQAAAGLAYAFSNISATPAQDTALLTEALGLAGLAGVSDDGNVWRTTCCRGLNAPGLSICRDCPARTRQRRRSP